MLCSVVEALDKNRQTDISNLYFPKAFNTDDHVILFEKLKWYGVTGQLINWFSDYLKERELQLTA